VTNPLHNTPETPEPTAAALEVSGRLSWYDAVLLVISAALGSLAILGAVHQPVWMQVLRLSAWLAFLSVAINRGTPWTLTGAGVGRVQRGLIYLAAAGVTWIIIHLRHV